jgi:hypothetical protein
MPDTVCVQERLPPGAAAVLINRTHPFRDLVLPIDAEQKKLFDAINGARRIEEISTVSEATRDFFARLWQWDQIVLDTSGVE